MRLSCAVFARLSRPLNAKVETFPRPLGFYRNYIEPSDVVHDFGNFKLVRARPSHVPLLIDSFKDFVLTEPVGQSLKLTNPKDEYVVAILHNVTRYPFSFFAVNKADEIVGFAVQDVVYRENSEDPRPRYEVPVHDPKDPMNAMGAILGYGEQRLLEILKVDKVLHNEVAYVPSSLRQQKISSTMYPTVMRLALKEAVAMGLKYNVGIVTGRANLGNMKKLKYTLHEKIPEEIYVDIDGKRFEVPGEETATLISMDMEEALKKKVFG